MADVVSERLLPDSDPPVDPGVGTPLVVVVSPETMHAVEELAAAGWNGPVLMVGTVTEAQQVLGVSARPNPDQAAGHWRVPETPPGPPPAVPAGILLDPDRQLLVCGDRDCALTPLEYGVLEALHEEPGRVRRFSDLTRRVWGMAHVGDGGQVHAVVRRIRRKLELVAAPVQIIAVRGVGFRLVRHSGPHRHRLAVAD